MWAKALNVHALTPIPNHHRKGLGGDIYARARTHRMTSEAHLTDLTGSNSNTTSRRNRNSDPKAQRSVTPSS
jgi:hypothetical protein